MDIIVEFLVPLVGIVVVYVMGRSHGRKVEAHALGNVISAQATHKAYYLSTLRRELANLMIWRNPQRYLQLYHDIHTEVSSLGSWRPDAVQARLKELVEKYPTLDEFDLIGTREYVFYADSSSSYGDIEERYRDLVMFTALSAVGEKDRVWALHTTSDRELAHLTEYVQKVEDTKLYLRLERAMDDYYMHRRLDDEERRFSNDYYTIDLLYGDISDRYSIHLRRTNEFGIYSCFVRDDGHMTQRYCRSNPTFDTEEPLDPLRGFIDEIRLER